MQFNVASSAQTTPVGRGKHSHCDRGHGDGHRAAVVVLMGRRKEGGKGIAQLAQEERRRRGSEWSEDFVRFTGLGRWLGDWVALTLF